MKHSKMKEKFILLKLFFDPCISRIDKILVKIVQKFSTLREYTR